MEPICLCCKRLRDKIDIRENQIGNTQTVLYKIMIACDASMKGESDLSDSELIQAIANEITKVI